MRVHILAAGALAALALTACSSSTAGTGSGSSVPPPSPVPSTSVSSTSGPSRSGSSPSTSASSPPSSGGAAGGLSAAQARGALISASDVGSRFAAQRPDTSTSPFPCTPNDPPLNKQVPPSFDVRTAFLNQAQRAEVTEEIAGYADEATTAAALAAGEKGLDCSSGTITSGSGSQRVQISGPTDVTSALKAKVDKAEIWQLEVRGAEEAILVSKVGPQLVVLEFTAASSADQSKLPSTQKIAETALSKVLAAS